MGMMVRIMMRKKYYDKGDSHIDLDKPFWWWWVGVWFLLNIMNGLLESINWKFEPDVEKSF